MREQITLKEHAAIKRRIQVLRPPRYKLIRESVKRDRQILLDCVLLTGMRLEERISPGKMKTGCPGRPSTFRCGSRRRQGGSRRREPSNSV